MKIFERVQLFFLRSAAYGSGLLIIAVFLLMLYLAWPLLSGGQFFHLITDKWSPDHGQYGVLAMVAGSLAIALLALSFALPISLGTSFVAATLAPRPLRRFLLAVVRFMAAIPTVIYGFVAVFLLVPFMREHLTGGSGLNILTAAMILALLIAPTMIVFFVDGLCRVAKSFCLAIDALGASRVQKLLYLQLPQAWPTIVAGVVMGLGRAMGDTLISLMLAGNSVAMPSTATDSGRTLTAHIALVIAADFSSMEFKSIFAAGMVLYVFSAALVGLLRLCTGMSMRWGRGDKAI